MRRFAFALILLWPGLFVRAARTESPSHTPPDLVVVLVADQVRFDYIERFSPWMTERGFKRLMREGATFTNARYRHAVATTAAGHAAIGAGLTPSKSGIAGNKWFERNAPVDLEAWE